MSDHKMIYVVDNRYVRFQPPPPFSKKAAYAAYCEWHGCLPEVPQPPWCRKYLDAWRRKYNQ